MVAGGGVMPRQCQTRSPVLRVARNDPLAQIDKAPRCSQRSVCALETLEREICAIGDGLHERLPRFDRSGEVALSLAHVTEIEIGGCDSAVDVDDVLERLRRA